MQKPTPTNKRCKKDWLKGKKWVITQLKKYFQKPSVSTWSEFCFIHNKEWDLWKVRVRVQSFYGKNYGGSWLIKRKEALRFFNKSHGHNKKIFTSFLVLVTTFCCFFVDIKQTQPSPQHPATKNDTRICFDPSTWHHIHRRKVYRYTGKTKFRIDKLPLVGSKNGRNRRSDENIYRIFTRCTDRYVKQQGRFGRCEANQRPSRRRKRIGAETFRLFIIWPIRLRIGLAIS